MPQTLSFSLRGTTFTDIPVATEEELLAFANRVREAGGATILRELLPSNPGDRSSCLIANALNFGCSVDCIISTFFRGEDNIREEPRADADGSLPWGMFLPDNVSTERARVIAEAAGGRLRFSYYGLLPIVELPKEIGNAAAAFDADAAFQSLSAAHNG